ncbi:hypothetical protein PFISCL1PPCAC_21153, partial [Pristionchus fissidentatus]
LHVSKQILAQRSTFFEALFFGNFKESKQSEVEIEDVTVKEMLAILNIIYGLRIIQDETVEIVLKLADRFGMAAIQSDVEAFLLRKTSATLNEKLFLADQYRMPLLLDKCMNKLDSQGKIRALRNEDKFDSLSPATVKELFDKLLKLKSCEHHN